MGTDAGGGCQVGLPAGFTPLAGPDDGVWTDRTAILVVTAVPTAGLDFAAFTRTIPGLLAADQSLRGFRQVREDARPDRYRLDFTAEANPSSPFLQAPSAGTLAAVPGPAGQACLAQLLYPQGQEARYDPLADAMVASLRATGR